MTFKSLIPSPMKTSPALLVAASLLLFASSGCSPKRAASVEGEASVAVKCTEARASESLRERSGSAFLGLVRADSETLLSFKVPGQLILIGSEAEQEDWREGSLIARDTIVAKLDPSSYASAVDAARARAQYTRAAYSRHSELYAAASLSRNDLDASRAQMETAEAELAHAEQNLRDTVLRAPYSGTLLARYQKRGEVTAAGRPVLRLGDFERAAVEVGVPETLLGILAVGQNHPVRLNAFPGELFTGVISEIGSAAAEGSRLFRVVLKVANPNARLKSGMTASVRFAQRGMEEAEAVIIPLSALFADTQNGGKGARASVYVVGQDSIARKREIVTGDLVASSVIVRKGLQAGERVVTSGAAQLHDGSRVTILTH